MLRQTPDELFQPKILRLLTGHVLQRGFTLPVSAPPVLQLVPALIAGGDDKPRLFMLRITERLVLLHHLAKDGLGRILGVRHVFQQHQTDLIHHGPMAAIEVGHFLFAAYMVHSGHLLLSFYLIHD